MATRAQCLPRGLLYRCSGRRRIQRPFSCSETLIALNNTNVNWLRQPFSSRAVTNIFTSLLSPNSMTHYINPFEHYRRIKIRNRRIQMLMQYLHSWFSLTETFSILNISLLCNCLYIVFSPLLCFSFYKFYHDKMKWFQTTIIWRFLITDTTLFSDINWDFEKY